MKGFIRYDGGIIQVVRVCGWTDDHIVVWLDLHNDYKYIEAPILIIDEIKEKYLMLASKRSKLAKKGIYHITLCAHPFVITYLKAGFPSIRTKWYFQNKLRLHLRSNNAYKFLQYTFFDPSNNTITF